jgi:hypothetical protein
MKAVRWFVAGVALGLLSSASFAFQEQRSGGASPSAPSGVDKAPAVDLTPPPSSPSSSSGPEIRIPGFGRLGLLPKLDLGLELLYGASESDRKPSAVERSAPTDTDDENLRIRGTLKHRF